MSKRQTTLHARVSAAILEAAAAVFADGGERLQAGRLEEVPVPEAFGRAVRALVAVGDYFVVVSRESARSDPAEFERRVASPLRRLIERAQSLGEVRDDLPASWLMESL